MLIKKLTDTFGLPGFENEIRNVIKEEIKDYVDKMYVDKMGNLIAIKNENAKGKHIALGAHMDEVGLVVKGIDKDGYIKIDSWGADPRILVAKTVKIGKNKIPGVIGSRPIHLVKQADRKKAIKLDELYIDIGLSSKEETEKLVSLGDFIGFDSEFTEFGEHKIKAKALDDRVGCAIIIEMLKSDIPYKITAAFSVQEEVGLRGSFASANKVFADVILNLEGTVCSDTAGVKEHLHVTTQGEGPALSLSDRTSVYLKKYVNSIVKVAEKNNIKYQFRRTGMGGTDAANFHGSHGGTPVIGISVPCRYIHSPVSIMDKRDYEAMKLLVEKYIIAFNEEELF